MTRPNQGLSSLAPGSGKIRDPGNEVVKETGDENKEIYHLEVFVYICHQIPMNDVKRNVWQWVRRIHIQGVKGLGIKKLLLCYLN